MGDNLGNQENRKKPKEPKEKKITRRIKRAGGNMVNQENYW